MSVYQTQNVIITKDIECENDLHDDDVHASSLILFLILYIKCFSLKVYEFPPNELCSIL